MPCIAIAGLRVGLKGSPAPVGAAVSPFLVPEGLVPEGPVDLAVDWKVAGGLPNPDWKGEADFEDLPGGVLRFRRTDFEGCFDPVSGKGTLVTAPLPNVLRAALRYLVSLALVERDGFLLHSAGLLVSDRAYLLCGASGAGKSTAAGLAAGRAEVLSDELCAVRREAGVWKVWGTPFAGALEDLGSIRGGPLAALAFLEQAPEVRADPIGSAEAVRRLYPQVFRPSRDPGRHARWLALGADLCARTACLNLRFRKDPAFLEVLGGHEKAA